jgi:hypothetical protein
MGCCGGMSSTSRAPRGIREETLLRVPGASVHLLDGAEGPVELARGDLAVVRIAKDGVAVATVARVGRGLGWPITRDEPVVRLDRLHYLFTLPDSTGGGGGGGGGALFLNYGVSFAAPDDALLASLDAFLKANACFSTPSSRAPSRSSATTTTRPAPTTTATADGYWNDFAPRMDSYNNVLAKAIAAGTGQLVRGIFMCSEAYATQVRASDRSLTFNLFSVQSVDFDSASRAGSTRSRPDSSSSCRQRDQTIRRRRWRRSKPYYRPTGREARRSQQEPQEASDQLS